MAEKAPVTLDARRRLPSYGRMSRTRFFQALGDETRLRIMMLLARAPEMPVCGLVHALRLPQPKVSRHLAYLRDARLAAVRRHAQWVCYRLSRTLEPWEEAVLAAVVDGLGEADPYRDDLERLREITSRTDRCRAA